MPPYEAILVRLLRVADLIFEDRDRLTRLEHQMREIKKERSLREKSRSSTIASFADFLKEIMPPQYWILALFLLLASLAGIITPKQVISQVIGNAPEPNEGSSSRGE